MGTSRIIRASTEGMSRIRFLDDTISPVGHTLRIFLSAVFFCFLFLGLFSLRARADEGTNAGAEGTSLDGDVEEILAEDVIIELPEDVPDSSEDKWNYSGTPFIVAVPFAVEGSGGERMKALGFGIAARMVDDFYPLSGARTITMLDLAKALDGGLLDAKNEDVLLLAETLGADFAVTGVVETDGRMVRIIARVTRPDGEVVDEIEVEDVFEKLPSLLSRLSFEVLLSCNAALTEEDRAYLDYTEPYSLDAWLDFQAGLAVVVSMQAGIEAKGKEVKRARDALESALKREPRYNKAREALGMLEYLTGDLDSAEHTFRELATRAENSSTARFYLGVIAYQSGRFSAAKRELSIAVDLNPGDHTYWLYLGRVHVALEQPASARQTLGEGIRLAPENPDLRFALGMVLLRDELYEKASSEFEFVISRNPASASAHYNLGICHFKTRSYELASKHFRHYIELTEEDPDGDHEEVEGWIAWLDARIAE